MMFWDFLIKQCRNVAALGIMWGWAGHCGHNQPWRGTPRTMAPWQTWQHTSHRWNESRRAWHWHKSLWEKSLIKLALKLFKRSGEFTIALIDWDNKLDVDKTWTNLKTFFIKEHSKKLEIMSWITGERDSPGHKNKWGRNGVSVKNNGWDHQQTQKKLKPKIGKLVASPL